MHQHIQKTELNIHGDGSYFAKLKPKSVAIIYIYPRKIWSYCEIKTHKGEDHIIHARYNNNTKLQIEVCTPAHLCSMVER